MNSLAVMDSLLLAFWSPGPGEMLVLAVVALLLYGGDLPDMARSWGKTFAEFRRGINGFQNELNEVIYSAPEQLEYRDDTYLTEGYEESEYAQPEDADDADEAAASESATDEANDELANDDTIVEDKPTA